MPCQELLAHTCPATDLTTIYSMYACILPQKSRTWSLPRLHHSIMHKRTLLFSSLLFLTTISWCFFPGDDQSFFLRTESQYSTVHCSQGSSLCTQHSAPFVISTTLRYCFTANRASRSDIFVRLKIAWEHSRMIQIIMSWTNPDFDPVEIDRPKPPENALPH